MRKEQGVLWHRRRINRRNLFHERLESRCLFAAWQNPGVRCDVNADGMVTSRDAEVILAGVRQQRQLQQSLLQPRSTGSELPFYDVSGDGLLKPHDALLVINAISRNPTLPSVTAAVATDDDPNANGFLLRSSSEVAGKTSPKATVVLAIAELDLEQIPIASSTSSVEVVADLSGTFSIAAKLFPGRNRLTFTVTDELGRKTAVDRDVVVGNVITDWNAAVLNVIRDWTTTANDPTPNRVVNSAPPIAARNMAMIHVAMFDAINGVTKSYAPYLHSGAAPEDASPIAAASSAAFEVAKSLYPNENEAAVWITTLNESLRTVPDGPSKQLGVEFGKQVAQTILDDRMTDGSTSQPAYEPSDAPGRWNRTAPGFFPPMLPQWGNVRPFTATDIEVYRPEAPPSLESNRYAESVDEVMRLGGKDSTERTPEQTQIALFWADGGGTATPPGHWNRIATEFILSSDQSLIEGARTLALINLALADAAIASWDAKYVYDFWRPIDAIRRAADDGNSSTIADASWSPLITTPPFPSYTSGHSTFSGAAAEVLAGIFGDDVAFANRSDSHSGLKQKPLDQTMMRRFESFSQAAKEAGESRIFGGIHFDFDSSAGLEAGRAVGQNVVTNWLALAET